jgi:hypothetical protein
MIGPAMFGRKGALALLLSMNETDLASKKQGKDGCNQRRWQYPCGPAISVTTSVEPRGVLVTPTLMAAIKAAIMTASLVDGTRRWSRRPEAAPMKNMGMMKPPRQPDDKVMAVPHSLAKMATTNTETKALREPRMAGSSAS